VVAALISGSCPEDPNVQARRPVRPFHRPVPRPRRLPAIRSAEGRGQRRARRRRARARRPVAAFAHVESFDEGVAKAKAEGKAVLVDAWAPWCHTCLSMQNYVLTDASLAPLAERVVLVELDTDKPENAAFLEKYSVNVWPTFFVIDPNSGEATGLWPGSASVNEFRGFVEDGLAGIEAKDADPDSPARLMVAAKAKQASGDYAAAAKDYARVVEKAPADWPRRTDALMGWVFSLAQDGQDAECVKVGRAHLAEVKGAAVPADYAGTCSAAPAKRRMARRRQRTRKRSRDCASSPPIRPPKPAPTIAPTPSTSCLPRSPTTATRPARSRLRNSAWRCSSRPRPASRTRCLRRLSTTSARRPT
jgi:thiol-disulfide isomerase/thioredoxin